MIFSKIVVAFFDFVISSIIMVNSLQFSPCPWGHLHLGLFHLILYRSLIFCARSRYGLYLCSLISFTRCVGGNFGHVNIYDYSQIKNLNRFTMKEVHKRNLTL